MQRKHLYYQLPQSDFLIPQMNVLSHENVTYGSKQGHFEEPGIIHSSIQSIHSSSSFGLGCGY